MHLDPGHVAVVQVSELDHLLAIVAGRELDDAKAVAVGIEQLHLVVPLGVQHRQALDRGRVLEVDHEGAARGVVVGIGRVAVLGQDQDLALVGVGQVVVATGGIGAVEDHDRGLGIGRVDGEALADELTVHQLSGGEAVEPLRPVEALVAADQDVVARAAVDLVGPAAAIDRVVPRRGRVPAAVAVDHVVALAARHEVVAVAARHGIVARAAREHVVALVAHDPVGPGPTEGHVVALHAFEDVVARLAVKHVVAVLAAERVVAIAAVDLVVALAGEHQVVAVAGQHNVVVHGLARQDLVVGVDAVAVVVLVARVDHVGARGAIHVAVKLGKLGHVEVDVTNADGARLGGVRPVRMGDLDLGDGLGKADRDRVRARRLLLPALDGRAMDGLVGDPGIAGGDPFAGGIQAPDRHLVLEAARLSVHVVELEADVLDRRAELDLGLGRAGLAGGNESLVAGEMLNVEIRAVGVRRGRDPDIHRSVGAREPVPAVDRADMRPVDRIIGHTQVLPPRPHRHAKNHPYAARSPATKTAGPARRASPSDPLVGFPRPADTTRSPGSRTLNGPARSPARRPPDAALPRSPFSTSRGHAIPKREILFLFPAIAHGRPETLATTRRRWRNRLQFVEALRPIFDLLDRSRADPVQTIQL